MADQLDTPALLTRAAELLEQEAGFADTEIVTTWQGFADDVESDFERPASTSLIAAFGPDHARALAVMFRSQLARHRYVPESVFCAGCRDLWDEHGGCPTLVAARPLAEMVVQRLGEDCR